MQYIEIYNDFNNYLFVEQKRINGQMETVRDIIIRADDYYIALDAAGYANDNLWQLKNPRWYMYGNHINDQWLGG